MCIYVSGMGEKEIRVAAGFLKETGLIPPFSAEVAAVEADLLLCPEWRGLAKLIGIKGGIRPVAFYDKTRHGWERELWSLVCGVLLRRDGSADTRDARMALALALGAELDEHPATRVFRRPPEATPRRDSA